MLHPRLDAMVERAVARARTLGPRPLAIVYPTDGNPLIAAAAAAALGLITPVLVGPVARIREAAARVQVDLRDWRVVDTPEDALHTGTDAAVRAAELARAGEVAGIVKASLHTDVLLRAVMAKSSGLRTPRRLSHVFWFDCPRYHKPLILADAVIRVAPNTLNKQHIIANAVAFARCMGVAVPKIAILSAVETPTEAIPTTIEAATLIAWARANLPDIFIDGPFALDNAVSVEAARIKGITSPVAGDADIVLVPEIEAGNILYKSLVYLGGAECAGLVLGAKVPVVLTSRADTARARVASCALAVLNA